MHPRKKLEDEFLFFFCDTTNNHLTNSVFNSYEQACAQVTIANQIPTAPFSIPLTATLHFTQLLLQLFQLLC